MKDRHLGHKLKIATIAILLILTLSACVYGGEGFAFGTFYSVWSKDKKIDKKSIGNFLTEYENILSVSKDESYISKINKAKANQPISLSKEVFDIIKLGFDYYQITNKAFNIAIFPLIKEYKFDAENFSFSNTSIPSKERVEEVLNLCQIENFILNEDNLSITKLHDMAMLDLGGFAKGYAVDMVKKNYFNDSKNFVINIGGNLKINGNKKIGIQNPRGEGIAGVMNFSSQFAIATAGDYQRSYFIEDKRYHHVLNKDGYPSGLFEKTPIIAVSIIGESAMICDILSTAVMILPFNESQNLLSSLGYSAVVFYENSHKTIGEVDYVAN